MELWEEILLKKGKNESLEGATLREILENESYSALAKIREIIRNHKLDDRECFEEIEQIVLIYEEMGSNGGSRHDF